MKPRGSALPWTMNFAMIPTMKPMIIAQMIAMVISFERFQQKRQPFCGSETRPINDLEPMF
jgi:hypothetical protein